MRKRGASTVLPGTDFLWPTHTHLPGSQAPRAPNTGHDTNVPLTQGLFFLEHCDIILLENSRGAAMICFKYGVVVAYSEAAV